MKLPRDMSGRDLANTLVRHWGYRRVNQVGSHIILQTEDPAHHRISIPDHSSLRVGTLNGILRAVAQAKRATRDEIVASLENLAKLSCVKQILPILLGLLAASEIFAVDLAEKYAPLGRLIITNFASAPFPHPLRAQGHVYHDQVFSAEAHYQDSHVALFIPKDFRPGSAVNFVVHFHGWGNNVSNALVKYMLPEQFAASRCNAILIVPQGPLDASDSFGGKLEDADGFKRFMDEALEVIRRQGIAAPEGIGRIILSGHSGGYEVISAILARGGLTGKIEEVWLFDALYAKTERFALWFDHHPGRFIDLYTEHGGTKEESESLMTALTGNGVPHFHADETNTTPADLRSNHLLFLFSDLPHDDVMQKRETYRLLLETSFLASAKP